MDSSIRASVAMAVYNGEKYIREQVDSILDCMGQSDELVISYDRSTDATWQIITDYAASDSRIRVIENHNPGVQNNFTNAVMACRGQYIFLSDQDDVWLPGKIAHVVSVFQKTGADVVVHDGYMADEGLNVLPDTIFRRYGTYNSPIHNIVKGNFWGCCMAFRSSFREIVCPFPSVGKVGHDLWIGVLAGFYGSIARTDECLMKHRLHGGNVSTEHRRPLHQIVVHRLHLIHQLAIRMGKLRGRKRT